MRVYQFAKGESREVTEGALLKQLGAVALRARLTHRSTRRPTLLANSYTSGQVSHVRLCRSPMRSSADRRRKANEPFCH
jgi:hypothetical protein